MNTRQRTVIKAMIGVFTLLAIFPPFVFRLPDGATRSAGFSFILSPPTNGWGIAAVVDVPLLFAEWTFVLVVSGALYFLNDGVTSGEKSISAYVQQLFDSAKEASRRSLVWAGVVAGMVLVSIGYAISASGNNGATLRAIGHLGAGFCIIVAVWLFHFVNAIRPVDKGKPVNWAITLMLVCAVTGLAYVAASSFLSKPASVYIDPAEVEGGS